MDGAVARLERAHAADPTDAQVVVDLARAYLRLGRALRALEVLGPLHPEERDVAGRALGAGLGLEWLGVVQGADRFLAPARGARRPCELVLVHAGAFMDDREPALGNLAERPHVAAFVAEVVPESVPDLPSARAEAAVAGVRLPTAQEWKKLWRGGVFLDGDESRRRENPDPARLLPRGISPVPGVDASSAYGAQFATYGAEALVDESVVGVFDVSIGRYFVEAERAGPRPIVWRGVRDVA